jgi:hypothetical protein
MILLSSLLLVALVLCLVRSSQAKDGPVLFTEEEVQNARRNVGTYDWAKAELDLVLETCRPWMAMSDDEAWSWVTGQAVPRGTHVNPDLGCPSCGRDLYRHGNYPWLVSLDRPWKLGCPSCSEVFPKNDYAGFHSSGLGKGGVFSAEQANRSLLFHSGHPNPSDPEHGYAVDDGLGWIDGEGNRWWFVAYYNHWCTWTEIPVAAYALGLAYLYTGEQAYAHKGAVLLDRIADVYPLMDLDPWSDLELYNSHGGSGRGRVKGSIWENFLAESLSQAYDMVFGGMADDEDLVPFLSGKASQWGLANDKTSIGRVRDNIEINLLREFIRSCRDRRIRGNEGMTQAAMATAAAVLDHPSETPDALDWLFEPGDTHQGGGRIPATLIGQVDRDGIGNEASPSYCFLWMNAFRRCARVLERCGKHRDYDLHRDYPRLVRMYGAPYRLTALDRYTLHIGDTGQTGDPELLSVNLSIALEGYRRSGDPCFARLIRRLNDDRADRLVAPLFSPLPAAGRLLRTEYTTTGLASPVFEARPEAFLQEVEAAVAEAGPLELGSENLNGYGVTLFRSGHGHKDRLNIGLYYRGMDITPDLGNPEYKDSKWPKRAGWTKNTLSHNTVMVGARHQEATWTGRCAMFATSEGLGVVEVSSPDVYPETRDYRRTLAVVDLDDRESYVLDIFRVEGGSDHLMSFHAAEGEVETGGLDLVEQKKGTYAGPDIPFGTHYDGPADGRYLGSGFAYLYGVSRVREPAPGWWADWSLVDTWKTQVGEAPVRLRYHGLSPAGEAALAWGDPPQNKPGNPRRLRYLLQRNQGDDCRSLFVSVIEPYSGDAPNLGNVTRLDLGLDDGDLTAAAVRVVTAGGRTDLALSSTDPDQVFSLGDGVTAAGRFVWVSLENGRVASVFLLGGRQVETPEGILYVATKEYTGVVLDFHRQEVGPAWIDIQGDLPEGDGLKGTQFRVQNDGVRDACYVVQQVSARTDGVLRVEVGDTSFIRGLASEEDYGQGYVYDFGPGDRVDVQTVVHLRRGPRGLETVLSTTESRWREA